MHAYFTLKYINFPFAELGSGTEKLCKEQLISGRTNGVPDSSLTSSSTYSDMYIASRSRLDTDGNSDLAGSWKAADSDLRPWIKVSTDLMLLV